MLNNVVKVLMAANDLTPADIISSSGIPNSSFYKDDGLNIEEISSIFNISDINVAILNRLDDNAYSYKQLLFEALRCYLYNSSISNSSFILSKPSCNIILCFLLLWIFKQLTS